MSRAQSVNTLSPATGIPGGEIIVEYKEISADLLNTLEVRFGGASAHLVSANRRRAVAIIPVMATDGAVQVVFAGDSAAQLGICGVGFVVGRQVAADLHAVPSPAFNPA